MENNKQLVYGTIGLLSAAALAYYISRDSQTNGLFDPKIHTDEKMLELMDELKLEFTCMYVRHYNLLKKVQESGELKPQHANDLFA